ncbi:putative BURP domain-containing protein [Medicago truncatula]|uniref:Embryonic abundant-like protein n=1 Tax=Medicago truncatula TaxID=3880 RepID=G7ITL0_MEDTR|nr:embryonic abundant protein USP92 [Medicago truncatula]AES66786.2 embryonic abundant-like protein [Medicago truncatula]RHN75229.1 putative BURP domain-containing protein [Medicago truncatula]
MELKHILIFISVLSLALAGGSHASLPEEEYWEAVWPNTPIPSSLRELLKPGPEGVEIDDLPMEVDDTQYPKTFFYEHELYPGKTMKVQFSKRPFAQPYGVYTWMREIKDIEKEGYTFNEVCVKKAAAEGEQKFCAKSLGTLIGFSISKLGKNIQALSSSFIDKHEQYKIESVQNLGEKAVMCHRLNFQKVVFYCHEIHGTTAFMVPLVANDGRKTQALAVCHTDTSGMNHEMLQQIMKADPGSKPVCHFLGNKAILWVPNLGLDNAYGANAAV